jgi:hypothetical protein
VSTEKFLLRAGYTSLTRGDVSATPYRTITQESLRTSSYLLTRSHGRRKRISGQQQQMLHNEEGKEARVDPPGLLLVVDHDQRLLVMAVTPKYCRERRLG